MGRPEFIGKRGRRATIKSTSKSLLSLKTCRGTGGGIGNYGGRCSAVGCEGWGGRKEKDGGGANGVGERPRTVALCSTTVGKSYEANGSANVRRRKDGGRTQAHHYLWKNTGAGEKTGASDSSFPNGQFERESKMEKREGNILLK